MTAGTLLQYLISAFLFFPSDSWVVRFGMTETGGAPILDSALQVHISRRRRRAGRVTSSVARIRGGEGVGEKKGGARRGYSTHTTREAGGERATGAR